MLGNLSSIDQAAQAAAFVAGKNRPLIRLALKYWWVAAPAAAALGYGLWQRHKSKSLTIHGAFQDAAPVVSTVAALIMISEWANKQDPVQVAGVAGIRAGANPDSVIKDAEFSQKA